MKIHKALIWTLIAFVCTFILLNVLFAGLYNFYSANESINFRDWLLYAISAFTTFGFKEMPLEALNPTVENLIGIHLFISSLVLPILTALIFYFILNRPPKIEFSKYLTIREIENGEEKGKLTLCAKVGNKGNAKLYNLKMTLVFERFSTDNQSNILRRHGVENFSQDIPYLHITHRFQFFMEDLSYLCLKPLTENRATQNYDRILIVLKGKYGKFGEDFIHEHYYTNQDIIYSPNTPKLVTYINEHGKKPAVKIAWQNLHQVNTYEENKRKELEDKLKRLVESKKR